MNHHPFWRWRLWIQANQTIEEPEPPPKTKPLPKRYRPNVSVSYVKNRIKPPRASFSTLVVRCWECGDEHAAWQRKQWNGSHSQCPKCGSYITAFPR